MGQCSLHHMELDETGVGKCSVPMWMGGCPAGFCDKAAYGKRPDCQRYRDGLGHLKRMDGKYEGYIPGLACPGHGGPEAPSKEDDDRDRFRRLVRVETITNGIFVALFVCAVLAWIILRR